MPRYRIKWNSGFNGGKGEAIFEGTHAEALWEADCQAREEFESNYSKSAEEIPEHFSNKEAPEVEKVNG